jgi:cytochrome c peroxidase
LKIKTVILLVFGVLPSLPALVSAGEPTKITRPRAVHSEMSGNGHAQSWDGRLFIGTRNDKGRVGWLLRLFRPEVLTADFGGMPILKGRTWSSWRPLEMNGALKTGMSDHNALAIFPRSGFSENPFSCDKSGRSKWDGRFQCYELNIVTQHYRKGDDRLGIRRARVIVSEPKSGEAQVSSAQMLTSFSEFQSKKGPLRGLEPTITFDGRLLVWQGHPKNDGKIDTLMYSFNEIPEVVGGWTVPRPISSMYYVDRHRPVAGIAFHERYPIAKEPLKSASGLVYRRGELYIGAYPWITLDGTELFHTTTVAGIPGKSQARRGGLSVIGRWTGYGLRHIDGPLNPDRKALGGQVRLFFSSPGAFPSFWQPYRELGKRPIPFTRARPVFPLFGSNTSNYGEVSFEDHEDGNYVLFLRMNELIKKNGRIDPKRSPDSSGHFNTAQLNGAKFPQEYNGDDKNVGFGSSQGIYFSPRGSLRVKSSPSIESIKNELTVELWVKIIRSMESKGRNGYQFLIHKPGVFHLILEENRQLQATVFSGGKERRSGFVGEAIGIQRWTHLGISYKGSSGQLSVYQDGKLISRRDFGPGLIDQRSEPLIIGPGHQRSHPSLSSSKTALFILDELKISNRVRSGNEVGQSAYRQHHAEGRGQPAIALGDPIQRERLLLIESRFDKRRVKLGKRLFFEPLLSKNKRLSCASCHIPKRSFTDGLKRSLGVSRKVLRRNTPTVINRVFSNRQFWDGRSAGLESQALKPIVHPDEMALPIKEAVARINADPSYQKAFLEIFGGAVNPHFLGEALASFERTLIVVNSPVDSFERGNIKALSEDARKGRILFHGKARCVACHHGLNYSDEKFHNNGFLKIESDPGRFLVTRSRADRGRFKTPTLRNLSLTAPYLHSGSVKTLTEVIDLYDRGGDFSENRDSEIRPLGLTALEKKQLLRFLQTLSIAEKDDDQFTKLKSDPKYTKKIAQRLLHLMPMKSRSKLLETWTLLFQRSKNTTRLIQSLLNSPEYLESRVRRQYKELLHRDLKHEELGPEIARLRQRMTLAEFQLGIVTGTEFRSKLSDAMWLSKLYKVLLNRAADPAGLAAHGHSLRKSRDYLVAARQLVLSRERLTRLGKRSYKGLLGRDPTALELKAFRSIYRSLGERQALCDIFEKELRR